MLTQADKALIAKEQINYQLAMSAHILYSETTDKKRICRLLEISPRALNIILSNSMSSLYPGYAP